MVIDLTDQEWQQVLGILATAPWTVANPLLMKIGNQLRLQQGAHTTMDTGIRPNADGKEASHEQ
jgi:hypothetical protein